jgi:hypothetical protein
MENSKTIREWFDLLRPDIREKALENAVSEQQNLSETLPTLKKAILGSFIFDYSPQGNDYWWDIYQSINNGSTEFLAPKNTEQ